jgi:hypothetical protein
MGYEDITNEITTKVKEVTTANSYPVVYDNDPATTPTVDYWCHSSLAFGNANKIELGTSGLNRNAGVLTIVVVGPTGKGTGLSLEMADILASAFRNLTLGGYIRFKTPRIENVGRVNKKWNVNVICPFEADEI